MFIIIGIWVLILFKTPRPATRCHAWNARVPALSRQSTARVIVFCPACKRNVTVVASACLFRLSGCTRCRTCWCWPIPQHSGRAPSLQPCRRGCHLVSGIPCCPPPVVQSGVALSVPAIGRRCWRCRLPTRGPLGCCATLIRSVGSRRRWHPCEICRFQAALHVPFPLTLTLSDGIRERR